jgi:8-oxo-dGTP pyrophosphatase MutT (NUDIX family)
MTITKGPWKALGSIVTYQNPWIHVREDKVIGPDGKPGIFGVVTMGPGVGVLAMDKDNNVYLAKEYRYGVERITLEVIGGALDEGETKLAAAKRELQEESGITADRWTGLGVIDPFTTVIVSPQYLYLAQDLSFGEAQPEATEIIEIIKMPFQEAVRQVMDSNITHGGSVAAILKAKEYFEVRQKKSRQQKPAA